MFCCGPSFERCPRHNSNRLKSICMDPNCYQPLCSACQQQHTQCHRQVSESWQPTLKSLMEVRDQLMYHIDIEIKTRESQMKNRDIGNTKDLIKQHIDQFFYGSGQQRLRVLHTQKELLKSKATARLLLDILLQDRDYYLDQQFEAKFHAFLMLNIRKLN